MARRNEQCEAEGILLQAGATDPDKDKDPGVPGVTAPLAAEGQAAVHVQGGVASEPPDSASKGEPSEVAAGEKEAAPPNKPEVPAAAAEAARGGKDNRERYDEPASHPGKQPALPPVSDGEASGRKPEEQPVPPGQGEAGGSRDKEPPTSAVRGEANDGKSKEQPAPAAIAETSSGEAKKLRTNAAAAVAEISNGEVEKQQPTPAGQGEARAGKELPTPAANGEANGAKGPTQRLPAAEAEAPNPAIRHPPSAEREEVGAGETDNGLAVPVPAGGKESSRASAAKGAGSGSQEGDVAQVADASQRGMPRPHLSNGSCDGDAPYAATSVADSGSSAVDGEKEKPADSAPAHVGGDGGGGSAAEADWLAARGEAGSLRGRASLLEEESCAWDDRSAVHSTMSEIGSTAHLDSEIPDTISVASVVSEDFAAPVLPKDSSPQQGVSILHSDSGEVDSETFERGPDSHRSDPGRPTDPRDGFLSPGIFAASDAASSTGACAGTASLYARSDLGSSCDGEDEAEGAAGDTSARRAVMGKDHGSPNGVPPGALDSPRGPGSGRQADEAAGRADGGLPTTEGVAALRNISGEGGRAQLSAGGISEIQPLSSPDVAVHNGSYRRKEPAQLELEKDADVEAPALTNMFGLDWPDDGTLLMWGSLAAVAVGVVTVVAMVSTGRPRFR